MATRATKEHKKKKKKLSARAWFNKSEWIEVKAVADVFGVSMGVFLKGAGLEIARATRRMADEADAEHKAETNMVGADTDFTGNTTQPEPSGE